MKFNFPIIIIDEDFRSENASGHGIRATCRSDSKKRASKCRHDQYGDLTSFAQQQSRASAFVLSIDDEEFGAGSEEETEMALKSLRAFVEEIRFKNADIPIYLYGETRTSAISPTISCASCTVLFTCTKILRSLWRATSSVRPKSYLDSLAPPFFRALVDYAQDGSYSWHCPGHSGGVAFLKSPVGRMFHQFFGENMLRADVCNAVDELGNCLTTPGRWRHPNAMRRAFSMPTICISSPTAHPLPTRSCGIPPWRRMTSW